MLGLNAHKDHFATFKSVFHKFNPNISANTCANPCVQVTFSLPVKETVTAPLTKRKMQSNASYRYSYRYRYICHFRYYCFRKRWCNGNVTHTPHKRKNCCTYSKIVYGIKNNKNSPSELKKSSTASTLNSESN